MDPTLTQLVAAIFQSHAEIDRLRARVAELEHQLADLQSSDVKDT